MAKSHESHQDSQPGNSQQAVTRKGNYKARRYSLALFGDLSEKHLTEFKQQLFNLKISWIGGIETCPKTGRQHLQFYCEKDKDPKTKKCTQIIASTMNKIWPGHWEASKGSRDENIGYIMKSDTKIWYSSWPIPEPPLTAEELIKDEELYDWQKEIINIIKEPGDKRKIYWIWEEEGCAGKSTFAQYCYIKYGAIPLEGKKNDILNVAAAHRSKIYMYDVERSLEGFISYASIEKIKNGFYMSGKYEGSIVSDRRPHIFVFANFKPEEHKMSKDRWIIKNIGKDIEDINVRGPQA